MSFRNPRIEDDLTREAYCIYLCLGNGRSIPKLREVITHSSARTYQLWRHDQEWEKRINDYRARHGGMTPFEAGETLVDVMKNEVQMSDQYDWSRAEEFHKQLAANTTVVVVYDPGVTDIVNGQGEMAEHEYRSLLGSMIREFTDRFQAGEVRINNVNELEKLVKLDLLLMRLPVPGMSAFTQNNVQINTNEMHTHSNNSLFNLSEMMDNNPHIKELVSEIWREKNAGQGTN